ncbi:MAG: AraC family transcriptional regulator [Syntrophomonadaceae bacterium]|jgi:YesN/AraC family two-component response regulator|nr:AraC family transcriptional regulator [Syntrophomonadaceae bacterium]
MKSEVYKNTIESALMRENYERREEQWLHIPYEKELKLLECIKNGDTVSVKNSCFGIFPRHDGHLSDNPHRQVIYEFVASVTLITRFAIEGGLDTESAYSLSDAYIKLADKTKKREEVFPLFAEMAVDFTERVRRARQALKPFTPSVRKCMEYIDSNFHYKITLEDLGRKTGHNPAYLCVRFKEETGVSVTDYIIGAKINEAKLLLKHEDMSVSEIANTLGFCSQSYFTKIFKEQTGETPRNYRVKHFRTHALRPRE